MIEVYRINVTVDGVPYENAYRFLDKRRAERKAYELMKLRGVKAEVYPVCEEGEGGRR